MKKVILILIITLAYFTVKAQQFGIMAEAGMSSVAGVNVSSNEERLAQFYYGAGIFFQKSIGSSEKLDLRITVFYNQIRHKYNYEYVYPTSLTNSTYATRTVEDKHFINNTTLAILPIFEVANNVKLGVGINYTYWLNTTIEEHEAYYNSNASGGNKQLINETNSVIKFNNGGFVDRSSFGFNALFAYQINYYVSLGLSYRYTRPFKYAISSDQYFFNIFGLTTHINFN